MTSMRNAITVDEGVVTNGLSSFFVSLNVPKLQQWMIVSTLILNNENFNKMKDFIRIVYLSTLGIKAWRCAQDHITFYWLASNLQNLFRFEDICHLSSPENKYGLFKQQRNHRMGNTFYWQSVPHWSSTSDVWERNSKAVCCSIKFRWKFKFRNWWFCKIFRKNMQTHILPCFYI